MKKFILAMFFVLVFAFDCQGSQIPALNQAGLHDILARNNGKVILINFFATWCPPCKAEIPEIAQVRKNYPEDKLLILGLSVDDTPDPIDGFIKQTGINYPVYMAEKDVTDAYNVSSVPHNAFIATDGRLIISEPGMADVKVLSQVIDDLLKMKK